ncbi:Transcriptional regulatory protein DegU [Pedobacter sp. Bi27]|uniref:response regulator transcription factor n=1 Tax=unclassified Pedobacter TaxID=2628915 RepID=UPI001D311F70|nr:MULTISPECIES: response regulator transcription factor [unclassified Pedobacter]CAH0168638.1 Transcriptional regulatory protein DegU [Pedobacter sp. Bi36]CAH0192652.1 Transcriptional regulatory protein DegU [Pedobacter sp. Bi27]CAH0224485.1 Transcriptional regulatory protein DegU [Pedobacter sp. Bi126]
MQDQSISIAIVDDHTLFRSGLASLLEEFDEINVTFEAVNGLDLQSKINSHKHVQLVLMDINMPVMDGFAATKWVKTNHPNVHVLALSMLEDEKAIIGMLKAGAGGYMLKESTPSDLLTAIKVIVDKGFYVNELVSGRLLVALKDSDQKPVFSARELTFLQYCSTELTYKEIADLMIVSPRTVDNYRESLFAKLNIKSRTGLVVYGIKNNLITI